LTVPVTLAPRRRAGMADAVLAASLAFLLLRPALGAARTYAVPLLAAGYLAMAAAALAADAGDGAALRGARASRGAWPRPDATPPLGRVLPLGVGLAAVAAAGVVAGPAPPQRVGAAAAGLALLAAVAEEALFRRLLYARLIGLARRLDARPDPRQRTALDRNARARSARYGTVVAVLGSAALFALVHLPAYGTAALPVDLGAGLLLSWQRFASGRWTVPAVTHAAANLLAVT
jgi:membrane protease YdiL (CAAX protease family)